MDVHGRRAVDFHDDVARLQAGLLGRAALGDVDDLEACVVHVHPHAGAVEGAGVGHRRGQRLQIHHLMVVIEGDDKALQNAAADIAGVIVAGERALVLVRQAGDDAVNLDRAERHRLAAGDVAGRGPADAPAVHGVYALGMRGAQVRSSRRRVWSASIRNARRCRDRISLDALERAHHLHIRIVEGEFDRRSGVLRVEMLGIDQGDRLGAIVDPRDEAAEGLVADHARHGLAFDVAEFVERDDDKGLVLDGGVPDVERHALGEAAFHHAFARARTRQRALHLQSEFLGDRRRDEIVSSGVEDEKERPFAVDLRFAVDVVVDELEGNFGLRSATGDREIENRDLRWRVGRTGCAPRNPLSSPSRFGDISRPRLGR